MAELPMEQVRTMWRIAKELHESGEGTSIYRTQTIATLCRDLLDLKAKSRAAIRAVEAERDNLREFMDRCVSEWAWGDSVDGGDVQSEALRLGLIVEQTDHDPEQCEEGCPCEGSSRIYWLAWSPEGLAVLKRQKGETDE